MYPGVRIFKIWSNKYQYRRKPSKIIFTLIFIKFEQIFCVWGRFCHYFGWGIVTIFGHFRPFSITAIYCDFTAISVLEIIAEFAAFYCIFQITEIYCDFSDSHCDFHPSCSLSRITNSPPFWVYHGIEELSRPLGTEPTKTPLLVNGILILNLILNG